MKQCEYCRRGNLYESLRCEGCGAPFRPVGVAGDGTGQLAYIYDPRVFDSETIQQLIARSQQNIGLAPHGTFHRISSVCRFQGLKT